jgi:hypothetical protein
MSNTRDENLGYFLGLAFAATLPATVRRLLRALMPTFLMRRLRRPKALSSFVVSMKRKKGDQGIHCRFWALPNDYLVSRASAVRF